jgi:hypothetical protein
METRAMASEKIVRPRASPRSGVEAVLNERRTNPPSILLARRVLSAALGVVQRLLVTQKDPSSEKPIGAPLSR